MKFYRAIHLPIPLNREQSIPYNLLLRMACYYCYLFLAFELSLGKDQVWVILEC